MKIKDLKKKGWNDSEIKKAEEILEKTHQHDLFYSKMVFWSALVVIIFANLIVSLVLIPFLIVLNQWLLYVLIVLLAGTVGFLYNFLITDIKHLERKHHVWAGIIVPVLALGNMIVMVLVSNKFINDIKVNNEFHNPYIIAVVFAVSFILPYLFSRLIRNKD
jgi:hypothetical protein